MFGYIRFFLAWLVLISHIGIRVYGLNPGVMAVVVFYILAGYVVSHIYNDIIPQSRYKILAFYKDRLYRIYPLYLYTLLLTVVFLGYTSFGDSHFTFTKMIANLLIIPLNYYMYIDFTILKEPNWCLIPPAWSLGTELQAYLLLPLAMIWTRLKYVFAITSLMIYILANISILNSDHFGYRFIVGVFFIFLIGSAIHKSRTCKDTFNRYFPVNIWVLITILVPLFYITDTFSPTYTRETFIGLLIGIPLVIFGAKFKKQLPYNKHLGSLSYGIFLSHFLAIWILQYNSIPSTNTLSYVTLITLLSFFIAQIGIIFVEKPLNKLHIR